MQTEAFAFMPHWMGSAFAARGGGGWWTLRPPALILGHVVWLPYDKIFKAYVWKALGLWNWHAEVVSTRAGIGLLHGRLRSPFL